MAEASQPRHPRAKQERKLRRGDPGMTIAMGVSANFQGMTPANADIADRSNFCARIFNRF
ncbi:hypothetical protein MPL1032_230264 [Mesorhizobium plurifarium]|uniref:Uncharacterized protein n=1 Tax=Mesorhizobium plurifarium TaxID=69974 RepID=A0A0K2VZV8_MESPL|nr:hypothetical protein MPL1032_230264 [Mesorhizobium plurifarium]